MASGSAEVGALELALRDALFRAGFFVDRLDVALVLRHFVTIGLQALLDLLVIFSLPRRMPSCSASSFFGFFERLLLVGEFLFEWHADRCRALSASRRSPWENRPAKPPLHAPFRAAAVRWKPDRAACAYSSCCRRHWNR